MRSITFVITFMAMALFYALCDALPHDANLPGTVSDNITSMNISIAKAVDPNSINSVPNLSPDVNKNMNRCYYFDVSEKWSDMGGKHSWFVHDALYHLCDVIATFASNTGFKKDDTMKVCKPVDKGIQGEKYDRSIGMILTYRGPDDVTKIDAQYCYNLMAKAMNCDAGGEFIVSYGNPHQWWEAKADPNRHDCAYNGYETIM